MCEPFATLELNDAQCANTCVFKVRERREQLPPTIVNAPALYTLQGKTAEQGLIYYCNTPNRLSSVMKWIACYMALSRVRSLSELRFVVLTNNFRELIALGSPEGFLTRFHKFFGNMVAQAHAQVEEVLKLSWVGFKSNCPERSVPFRV